MRDRLWFFGSYRKLNTETAVEGVVGNANAFNLSRWDWVEDRSLTARSSAGRSIYIGRVTAQVAAKHRVSVNWEYQQRCDGTPLKAETDGCHTRGANWVAATATTSPEASLNYLDVPYTVVQGRWTNPMTNRLLLEAGGTYYSYRHAGGFLSLPPDGIFDIGVTELSTAINPATGAPYAPRSNYVLPRALRVPGRHRQPEQLERVSVVCDRLAQHEGRLSGCVPGREHDPSRQPDAAVLQLQSGRPDRASLCASLNGERPTGPGRSRSSPRTRGPAAA